MPIPKDPTIITICSACGWSDREVSLVDGEYHCWRCNDQSELDPDALDLLITRVHGAGCMEEFCSAARTLGSLWCEGHQPKGRR